MSNFNPIRDDPLVLTDDFAPVNEFVRIESSGAMMNGNVFVAQGAGPHPLVMFAHGFPGTEKNEDLAHGLRRAGFNTLVFTYRGAWGSEGNYSFTNIVEDVGAALTFCRENAEALRIDTSRIALVGYSMGGFAVLMAALQEDGLCGVCSMAGFNLGGFGKWLKESEGNVAQSREMIHEFAVPLRGTSGNALIEEAKANGEQWDLEDVIDRLPKRPLALVAGLRDPTCPIEQHHTPLVKRAIAAGLPLTEVKIDAGHSFIGRRIELAEKLLRWLNGICGVGA